MHRELANYLHGFSGRKRVLWQHKARMAGYPLGQAGLFSSQSEIPDSPP